LSSKSIPVLVVALALLPANGSAQPHPVGRPNPGVVENWMARIESAELELRGGEFKKAKRKLDRLLDEMVNRIEGGPEAGTLLGTPVAYRAIAYASLGQIHEASWGWSMANNLFPGVEKVDLDASGPIAEAVEQHLSQWTFEGEGKSSEELEDRDLVVPRRIGNSTPRFPRAMLRACLEAPVIVECVIDAEGRIHGPRLETPDEPVLGFAAMDHMRTWRFQPARLDGKTVSVSSFVKVNFGLAMCENPFANRARN
jgi:hypothetical protein